MTPNRTDYGQAYFETLGEAAGLNKPEFNTCRIIDFAQLVLNPGERHVLSTGDREYGIVLFTGTADIMVDGTSFPGIGRRESVFLSLPSGVYAGCGSEVVIEAKSSLVAGLASAISTTPIPPYSTTPENCQNGHWGEGNTTRHFRYLIGKDCPSERLWLAEVVVRDGRWATYPPHKHEDVPGDLFQEEMYFYKVEPQTGFGFCALFGGEVGGDHAFMVRHNTLHKMPFGYHTVAAAPGHQVYYLAVYAGRDKGHRPSPHPDFVDYYNNPMPTPFV